MPCTSKPAPADLRKDQNIAFYKQKLQLHVHNATPLNKKNNHTCKWDPTQFEAAYITHLN